ncbi:MAG: tRNA pseudouridine(38-40) synthase TruA [Candidatus Ratteibacteria bacterium]|nr:tRNA pseudouridine(38-40) synthase TruA [Candidatus Ratteibacteria bacterium]
MPNYKLTIEYKGTHYHGWQRQKAKITVQGVIEQTLRRIFKQKITLIGQGRLDAGAHALGQVAHFKARRGFPPLNLKRALNGQLPSDIRIKNVQIADENFHARYSARARHYKYIVYNSERSVWLEKFAYFYPYDLNIKKMREGAKCLLGKHDFSCFQSAGSPVKSTVKTIKSVEIKKENLNFPGKISVVRIDIKADAFLYRMVRNIVGTLLEIGRDRIPSDEIKKILRVKTRRKSQTVPAYGLYLIDVKYLK